MATIKLTQKGWKTIDQLNQIIGALDQDLGIPPDITVNMILNELEKTEHNNSRRNGHQSENMLLIKLSTMFMDELTIWDNYGHGTPTFNTVDLEKVEEYMGVRDTDYLVRCDLLELNQDEELWTWVQDLIDPAVFNIKYLLEEQESLLNSLSPQQKDELIQIAKTNNTYFAYHFVTMTKLILKP